MTTLTLYAGSNTAAILDALTKEMGIENRIGAEEDARNGAPPRVVWVPVPRGRAYSGPPTDERADMKVAHLVAASFEVHLWGRDFFGAEELEAKLGAALFNRFSPRAYQLGAGDPRGGGAPGQQGYEFVVGVTLLRIPIAAELRQSVTLTGMTATGTTQSSDDDAGTVHGTITISL